MIISRYAKFVDLDNDVIAVFNALFMRVLFVDNSKRFEIEQGLVNDYEKEVLYSNGIYIK